MRFYIRLFVISLISFSLLFLLGATLINSSKIDEDVLAVPDFDNDITLPGIGLDDDDDDANILENIKSKSPLQLLVEDSDRVNFVVFAHDGSRADTIMFASFDPDNKYLDIISIPRDTYWLVEGYTERTDHKKINSVYGHASDKGGSKGLKQEIANMLQVPVNYYVKFNYNGASAVVNVLGGVEVNVPFDMNYDDVWAEPEVHIHLNAGLQTLDGKNAVDYLRWRKNNDAINSTGDLPRIARMQDFLKKALKKAMGLKLPAVINTGFRYVQSDIALNLAISYADDAIGLSSTDITTNRLPGEAPVKSSFYIGDPEAIEQLLIEIYSKGNVEE